MPDGDVFASIYRRNTWGFGSGHGSQPRVTVGYRRFLEDFIGANAVRSIVDFGCGDWAFSRAIDWQGAHYLGLDVVGELVERNRSTHGRPGVEFARSPDNITDLPQADLLVVKDVLQHWTNSMVGEFLKLAVPRYRYALITNDTDSDPGRVNEDIPVGEWRPLDIRSPPFNADATAVYVFRGPKVHSLRNLRQWNDFNAWTKLVLLVQTQR